MEKIKIGIFGAWRGNSYIQLFKSFEETEIVAICDKNADRLNNDEDIPKDAYISADFDDFLSYGSAHGMNAVFLANYFNEHAPYAIKAMKAGMNVISECTAAGTLKECVELAECVEETGMKYMLAENYPYMTANIGMEKLISTGFAGSLIYAEGEYNHSCTVEHFRELTPGRYHWRAWMPRTYYVTHALGPIMFATKSYPRYVSGRAAFSSMMYELSDFRFNYDGAGMMFCEMSNGMIARFTGCTAMASDCSRYRVCGDIASLETGGNIGEDKIRRFYFEHTAPENCEQISILDGNDFADKHEDNNSGHGGSDYRVAREMVEYFLKGKQPFFDVYAAVCMSATAILGWRSALNHGENLLVPDFRNKDERELVRNDDLTPFPDENGNGATLPCALPLRKN